MMRNSSSLTLWPRFRHLIRQVMHGAIMMPSSGESSAEKGEALRKKAFAIYVQRFRNGLVGCVIAIHFQILLRDG